MSDDITFCMDKCDKKQCFRHPSQMLEPWRPHSMAYLKNSGYCPFSYVPSGVNDSDQEDEKQ